MASKIPFNRPFMVGTELDYVAEVLNSGSLSADGPFTQRCAELLEQRFGIAKVLLTPSCTSALEMAAMLSDLGPNDEVLMPSFTFVSTANAFLRCGARPVFVDVRPDTLNMDVDRLEDAITPRTRAIVPVHYGGVGCDMDAIGDLAKRHGLTVIEDAAQGVNAFYRGQALGSLGQLGTFSFHDTKNFVCGEGGALCINTPELIERAEIIRNKGTNRNAFLRGEVDKYTWVDVGSSYVPSEVSSALLYAQLQAMDDITQRREHVYLGYRQRLHDLQEREKLQLPTIPELCQSNYHLFFVITADESTRDRLIAHLRASGIGAVFHYVPLHSSPMGHRLGYADGDLPVTENISRRLVRLPLFCDMTDDEQQRVADGIRQVLDVSTAVGLTSD